MTKEKSSKFYKVLTIFGTVMCFILIPLLIFNLTLLLKSFVNRNEVPSAFGVFPLIVLTDSMKPEIESGDLIICTTAKAEDIKVGDVISFLDPSGNGSSVVTHRVIEIVEENGEIFFRTRGDNNNAEDRELVPAENLAGIYRFCISGAGNAAMFMQSTSGLIICVILPIIIFIGYDFIRNRIYQKSQKEDTDALLAELEALRAEKAEKEKSSDCANNNGGAEND